MEINDLFNMGASLLKNKLGQDEGVIGEVLSSVLGNKEGGLDLSNVMSSLQNGNLGAIASSWIGSGKNASIDAKGVTELIGSEKINELASKLGVDSDTVADALKDVLPNMVDKATPDGENMLEKVGGLDGLMSMANKFL